ncbi:PaaI family thioesterase [Anaeroselena agilis]|uniref:PaaI family thioesterase n=1 Tax=Anaeroselena agilis TaxID=3063788 RepID=A0ABU3NVN8_9FIRM|nr:PaaI family thioesterase [Selenomonadales bacterium 4137-cl]
MTDRIDVLKEKLQNLYKRNPFVGLLKMKVEDVKEGEATLSMPIVQAIHGNLFGMAHGGATASLADTAMGLVCISLGKKVVTLDLNINYIYGATDGETVTAVAKVVHNGRQTVVVEAEHRDTAGRLLAKARGTFFVVGSIELG